MDKEERKAIRKQRFETFKRLPFKEKLTYIGDYYLMSVIITIVVVAAVISLIYTIFFNKTEKVLVVTLVNCQIEESDKLMDDFGGFIGVDGKKKQVSVSGNNMIFDNGVVDPEVYQSVNTLFYVGGLDMYMGTKKDIPMFAKNNYFYDLSKFLDDELFEKLKSKDMIYYYSQSVTDSDGTEYTLSKPLGIMLDGTAFAEKYKLVSEGGIVCVSATTGHRDNVLKFIEFILKE